jgi:thymidylate synthase (FAD)
VKQGSKATGVLENDVAVQLIRDSNTSAQDTYERLLAMGVAPEVARTVLPQGMYTEFIETGSLAAYARLCGLRLDPSAQAEIRAYADAVRTLLLAKFPVSWGALCAEEDLSCPSGKPIERTVSEEELLAKSGSANAC